MRAVTDDAVGQAFLTVPRELFVPGYALDEVYRDQAIVTKNEAGVPVSSSSQPAMMAMMLEQLDVQPGMRVLEIGAGTGYNAALLWELAGLDGAVTTIEIDPEIVAWARERLAAAGYDRVTVIEGDGGDGWPAGAPYDRIELTVGAADIAPNWVEQLKPGGILVLPLWVNTVQLCLALAKDGGQLRSISSLPCGFTRIRGRLAGSDQYRELLPGVTVSTGPGAPPDDQLRQTLTLSPRREVLQSTRNWFGFMLWLALHAPVMMSVSVQDPQALGFQGFAGGILDPRDGSVCLITLTLDGSGTATALSYGGQAAHAQFMRHFAEWKVAGAPGFADIGVVAVPSTASAIQPDGFATVDTANWRLTFQRNDAQK
jgi:protein-L-isoaspartate(D-aspartate) O-methyltransferase